MWSLTRPVKHVWKAVDESASQPPEGNFSQFRQPSAASVFTQSRTMKLSDKDTTPLSPNVLIRQNRAIDDDSVSLGQQGSDGDELGRQVRYEPTLVVTPVMTSCRSRRNTVNRPRLNKSSVDEVRAMLNVIFLKESGNESVMGEVKREVSNIKIEKGGDEQQQGKDESMVGLTEMTDVGKLGRMKVSMLSPKAMSPIVVHRSARLSLVDKSS